MAGHPRNIAGTSQGCPQRPFENKKFVFKFWPLELGPSKLESHIMTHMTFSDVFEIPSLLFTETSQETYAPAQNQYMPETFLGKLILREYMRVCIRTRANAGKYL